MKKNRESKWIENMITSNDVGIPLSEAYFETKESICPVCRQVEEWTSRWSRRLPGETAYKTNECTCSNRKWYWEEEGTWDDWVIFYYNDEEE